MAGAQDTDARMDPAGDLALQGGRDHAVVIGDGVPGRLGTPGGVCHAIEKCAGSDGLLRGGKDQALRCWQVVREEFQHSIRREVEKPTGVYFESAMNGSEEWSLLQISCRLADIRRPRRDVDERSNTAGDAPACVMTVPP